ncbi:hypothetical protein P8C59_006482 [Phyllachora maydis]|uniref:Uncharacterized protein n=1 Tax=Phyllachora maydis TaxID=1825666 RepID=A0AAD9MGS4_9PEZI|nr:hypothetical protein P8C59_006482 [Phyllachora maydis]
MLFLRPTYKGNCPYLIITDGGDDGDDPDAADAAVLAAQPKSAGGCTDADSASLNSEGLIVHIYILLKQAATLWHKEEAEEEAVYKAEIAIYKAYKHALPISPAVKKAASDTGGSNGKFVVRRKLGQLYRLF